MSETIKVKWKIRTVTNFYSFKREYSNDYPPVYYIRNQLIAWDKNTTLEIDEHTFVPWTAINEISWEL